VDGVDVSGYIHGFMQWMGTGYISAGSSMFLEPYGVTGTEEYGQYPVPNPSVAKAVYVNVVANTLDASATITIRKNGVDTAISITVGAGVTGVLSASGAVSFSAGDLISIIVDATGATTGDIRVRGASVRFANE